MPKGDAKYEAKMEKLRVHIRKVLDSGKAQLSPNILQLLRLTESPRDRILKHIEEPGLKIMDLERLLWNLCPHEGTRVQDGDGARCSECNAYLGGWWCPDSPDNYCYYYSEEKDGKRVVTLRNGTAVPLKPDHDPEYETDDSCLFCGAPDERK